MSTANREKLTDTARVIFNIGRDAYIAAGGLPYSEDEIKPAHVAAFNAIAEWHDDVLYKAQQRWER